MKQTTGDLWQTPAQVKVVPTNGMYTSIAPDVHRAHMGAGVAKQAALLWPRLPLLLGERLREYGNQLFVFQIPPAYREAMWATVLVAFPTKNRWIDSATPILLDRSTRELLDAYRQNGWENVLMPRVGCGLGGLAWEEVEPMLQHYLSDAFTVITKER